eukprot:4098384-Amphidinium_carterae.1
MQQTVMTRGAILPVQGLVMLQGVAIRCPSLGSIQRQILVTSRHSTCLTENKVGRAVERFLQDY